MLQDITDRKRAEKALRDSETRYRLLFERNPAGMFRSTVDGKLLEANEAFARIFGYKSHDEFLLYPITHFYLRPEEPPLVAKLRDHGPLTDCQFCGQHRDGTPVWVLANMAYVVGEKGGPDVLEGTFIDITARKNAEEALQHSEAQLRRS
jgi:PAS domain S-box-containing protein